MIGRFALRAGLIMVLVGGFGGCAWISSWFSKSPKALQPVAATLQVPIIDIELQSASAARAACPNYDEAVRSVSYPRAAIIRGIDAGNASVSFVVDDTKVTVLSVTSSDPAFGNAATDIVRRLACRVDHRSGFEVPFSWRTTR